MSFENLIISTQKYFPDLQIKYKNQSWFMKLLGTLLFFNKSFMTSFTTTIGSTVYFPDEDFVKGRPVSASIIFLHELVHLHDSKKYIKYLFNLLYLSPQILFLLFLPLLFISWKIAIICMVICLLPLPAFFRMYFERRAYMATSYVTFALSKRLNFDPKLDIQCDSFIEQFKTSSYYWMWIFKDIDEKLKQSIIDIKNNKRPFEDPVFDILDDLVKSV